jgi:hypothetical protein
VCAFAQKKKPTKEANEKNGRAPTKGGKWPSEKPAETSGPENEERKKNRCFQPVHNPKYLGQGPNKSSKTAIFHPRTIL